MVLVQFESLPFYIYIYIYIYIFFSNYFAHFLSTGRPYVNLFTDAGAEVNLYFNGADKSVVEFNTILSDSTLLGNMNCQRFVKSHHTYEYAIVNLDVS